MLVLVGSDNPVKQAAVREAFGLYFEAVRVEGIAVPSGVPEQPVGEQTFAGARSRARQLRRLDVDRKWDAQFYVGIEGGIVEIGDRWFALGCMCVTDRQGHEALGTSPQFELPGPVVDKLLSGHELGQVVDGLTGQRDTKRKGGAIGHFTRGVMDRKALYVAGLTVALVPLLNGRDFFDDGVDGA